MRQRYWEQATIVSWRFWQDEHMIDFNRVMGGMKLSNGIS